jgi:sulfur-oxidizing protein SoxZ
MARTIINLPATARPGDVVEVRTLVQHPMETGYRQGQGQGPDGAAVPRDLIRRVEARFNGTPVFAADLHAAVSANPYIAFFLKVDRSGELVVTWRGDKGFEASDSARVVVLP